MIGFLRGIVKDIEEGIVLLDVNGVGYELFCTNNIATTHPVNSTIEFFIQTVVKENEISLYGFSCKEEKQWFNILQSVQGVGAKMALNILSTYSPHDIATSIFAGDEVSFKRISGVGPKLASRIVNELKDKKGLSIPFFPGNSIAATSKVTASLASANSNTFNDALSALINLGFQRKDVFLAISEINNENDNTSLEDLIKLGLAKLTG